ncbi:MAG: prepilin-type N-terminal cleavage/methylation domain-containing protein [Alphaproteobacteria bacterium]|nr:prepilin-type N-terminal cleavage/methylation domain-containing protein [Alphaproteobacteria bacterium]
MTYIDENNTKTPYQTNSQSGVTLMEMIAALAIIAVIIVGSLALYRAATSSQSSTQLVQDVISLRSATKSLFLGQGTYGAAGTDLNPVLLAAQRVPSTIRTTPAGVFTHSLNGAVNVTAQAAQFDIVVANIPTDVCIPLITGTDGWATVTVGAAVLPMPTTPAAAAAACAGGPLVITFRSN